MTDAESPTVTPNWDCQCKVGRGIDTYDLDSVNEELVRRWTGEGRERQSLRELATYYNRTLLSAAFEAAGKTPLSGAVANAYELLTDDSVSPGNRTQTRRRLEADGVPLDTVESLFVSHQTVHNHLTRCGGVTRDDSASPPAERRRSDRDRIRALQRRTEVVTTDALDRLADADALALEEFDVLVDVTVLCRNCGTQHDVGSLLNDGGCDCRQ